MVTMRRTLHAYATRHGVIFLYTTLTLLILVMVLLLTRGTERDGKEVRTPTMQQNNSTRTSASSATTANTQVEPTIHVEAAPLDESVPDYGAPALVE